MDSFLHDMSWVVPLRSPELTRIFSAITLLGYFEFFLVMLPLGYWLWDKALFTRLAILVGIVGLSNSFLKDLFQDPRPPIGLALDGRVGDSFGLPSGHAQVATAMWLWLAYEIKRPWAWIVAIVTAAGVCASRLYLAVHDIEDILGGILLGLGSIAVFAVLISDDLKAWYNLNPAIQLAAIAALAPLMWLIWPRHPLPPSIYALVAFIFFWWLGRAIEQRAIQYKRHKNWLVAGFATVAGIAVLFGFMWISAKPLEALPKDAALAIQFAVISLYVTALAPAAFRALGLADRSVT
jgi:membrane-associated phospholipid phosphatase